MLKALKDNPLLAASVALPLLLVLVFAVARFVPRLLVSPPGHDLILAHAHAPAADARSFAVSFFVEDGRVAARAVRLERPATGGRQVIYRYDHETGALRELSIDWPEDLDSIGEEAVLSIPDLADVNVSTSTRAPDGYEYRGFERHDGLLFGLFGGGRRNPAVTIAKDGAIHSIDLPESSTWWWGQAQFIGWVVP